MNNNNNSILRLSAQCIAIGFITYLILTLPSAKDFEIYTYSALMSFAGSVLASLIFYPLNKFIQLLNVEGNQFFLFVFTNAILSTILVDILVVIWITGLDITIITDVILSPLGLYPLAGIGAALIGVFANRKYILKNFSSTQNL